MGRDMSKHGDIYSYGILLMEMLTGQRQTDDMFKDGLNLRNYVKKLLPNQVMHAVDPQMMFKYGLNLHNYVKMVLPNQVMHIMDSQMLTAGEIAVAKEEEEW